MENSNLPNGAGATHIQTEISNMRSNTLRKQSCLLKPVATLPIQTPALVKHQTSQIGTHREETEREKQNQLIWRSEIRRICLTLPRKNLPLALHRIMIPM